ncbi:ATP-binding cassette domain-containing protein [Alteromonas sp. a30]|uniref:ATP-binding cassette domain-containing protein n=1 Tax=Alteromonas sp. a30 TaxID=2730917 RepID=UPI00227F572B|nr:ATP-binding cassette domain-containing protein [Alteromonas sp. a30]MCY7295917.1 ATP-binding cassette domain-containing protein [Alteromonas sp. a30]
MTNPFVALCLALIHASSGIILLIFSSWFIAACAIAGVNFNYMLPAVVIRALALIRIASGYGQMWVGHQHLLDRIAKIRLRLFKRLQNAQIQHHAMGTDALAHHSEAMANLWMAWINQNASAVIMLLIGLLSLIIWLPSWQWSLVLLLVVYLVIIAVMCWRGVKLSQKIVLQATEFRRQSNDFLNSASIWHLQPQFTSPSAKALWQVKRRIQQQSDNAALLLQGIGFSMLLILLFQANTHALSIGPVVMIGVILLLSTKESLSPSLYSQRALTDYFVAKNAFSTLPVQDIPILPTIDNEATHSFSLSNFSAQIPFAPQISIIAHTPQIVLISGSSGTGKSTLLQACAGHMDYSGERFRNGKHMEKGLFHPWHYIEQLPKALNGTIYDNLTLANSEVSPQKISEVFASVGLEHLMDLQQWLGVNGRTLSGGELKRFALARAMLCDFDLLLVDEPFEGLDALMQARISNCLNQIAETKIVIVASHITPDTLHVTQRINLDHISLKN